MPTASVIRRDGAALANKEQAAALTLSAGAASAQAERGYLNPGDRGTRADECEAIANFLTDSLAKSR